MQQNKIWGNSRSVKFLSALKCSSGRVTQWGHVKPNVSHSPVLGNLNSMNPPRDGEAVIQLSFSSSRFVMTGIVGTR